MSVVAFAVIKEINGQNSEWNSGGLVTRPVLMDKAQIQQKRETLMMKWKTLMAAGIKVSLPFSRPGNKWQPVSKVFYTNTRRTAAEQLFFHFLLVLRFWSGLGKHELDWGEVHDFNSYYSVIIKQKENAVKHLHLKIIFLLILLTDSWIPSWNCYSSIKKC